ncbi:methyltransferase, TIGR04325 family [Haliea sp.]|uniref:methyltransferase, TIGR04325 family n=1 Tax=Haliea sp. TaxID=1932666 RepID=UPI0035299F9C
MVANFSWFRHVIPPLAMRWLRQATGRAIRFSGDYSSWQEALDNSLGYDLDAILNSVLDATLRVKRGEAAYERDSVVFHVMEYNWRLLAALMWAAGVSNGKLSVLDYGGALGSLYFQHKDILSSLPALQWNIVEQSRFVEAGRKFVEDETVVFFDDLNVCLSDRSPNAVVMSGVLQYLEHPRQSLQDILSTGSDIIFIDRIPFHEEASDRITVQRVPSSIYPASYPSWIFCESKFVAQCEESWKVVSISDSFDGVMDAGRGDITFKSIILKSLS